MWRVVAAFRKESFVSSDDVCIENPNSYNDVCTDGTREISYIHMFTLWDALAF